MLDKTCKLRLKGQTEVLHCCTLVYNPRNRIAVRNRYTDRQTDICKQTDRHTDTSSALLHSPFTCKKPGFLFNQLLTFLIACFIWGNLGEVLENLLLFLFLFTDWFWSADQNMTFIKIEKHKKTQKYLYKKSTWTHDQIYLYEEFNTKERKRLYWSGVKPTGINRK